MGEVVNVLVAFAVIVFVVRWATSGKEVDPNSPAALLGFKPKNVSPEQVETIHNMFPDIPPDNIRYDLLRTGSVQLTSNKILERGFLPAPPPAYYRAYPQPDQPAGAAAPATANAQPAPAAASKPKETLIQRFQLENRVVDGSGGATTTATETPLNKWEEAPEKREASLRERKARMVLAARERLLAQQRQREQGASSSSSA